MKTDTSTDTPLDLAAVKSDLAALRDDLAAFSRSAVRRGVRSARRAQATVEDGVATASGDFEGLVGDRPYSSMLIAFGAGVGAGVVAASILRRH